LYQALLHAWNTTDAGAFAVGFARNGRCIGFDGTEYVGPEDVEQQLHAIFKDHKVATYVAKVREITPVTTDVAVLRAIAGMLPPGGTKVMPERNAIQTLVAARAPDGWKIMLYQNTPAKYDGRPKQAQAMTEELQREAGFSEAR
jgi:uncharacterized protein (TIGR02246 family)